MGNVDVWRDDLNTQMTSMYTAVVSIFGRYHSAQNLPELVEGARLVNRGAMTEICHAQITAIERWYCQQHNSAVSEICSKLGMPVERSWRTEPDAGILRRTQGPMMSLIEATSHLGRACSEFVEFAKHNNSMGGCVEAFLEGILDPLNAIAGLFDESRLDQEYRRLNLNVKQCHQEFEGHSRLLLQSVDDAVVALWNTKTLGVFQQIESAYERRLAEEERRRRVQADGPKLLELESGAPSVPKPWLQYLSIAALVLSLICALYMIFASSRQLYVNPDSRPASEPGKPALAGVLEPSELRSGPGESFGPISRTDKRVAAYLVDATVPGWKKVRLNNGVEGWVIADRFSE
jgi:hypothetical protein